jgi:hypothetical protein
MELLDEPPDMKIETIEQCDGLELLERTASRASLYDIEEY